MIGWWVQAAFADPPNHIAKLWDINPGGGEHVERMAVSQTGNVVAGRTRGDLKGWLIDVDGWLLDTFGGTSSGCEVSGVAVRGLDDGSEEVWASCGDGSVHVYLWNGVDAVPQVLDDGAELNFLNVDESLSGIWYDPGSDLFYALYVPEDGAPLLHVLDPVDLVTDSAVLSQYPKTFPSSGFVEGVVTTDGKLVVAHGGQTLTWIQLGSDAAPPTPNTFSGAVECDDLAPSPRGTAYCVGVVGPEGSLGSAAEFQPQPNQWIGMPLGEILDPNAICANLQVDGEGALVDGWLAVTGLQVKVWEMSASFTIPDITPYFEGPADADNQIQDMVTDDGYLYGGGVEGRVHVVTARPWVEPIVVTPTAATNGDIVSFKFRVDSDVDWKLVVGESRGDTSPVVLDQGSSSAEEDVTVDIEVGDQFEEGVNYVYALVTNANDLTGHGRIPLSVDNPPDPPVLTNANVKFADGGLILDFEGIDDADLDQYEVYVSTAPFLAADYPSGGPIDSVGTSLKLPVIVDSQASQRVSERIAPLENGVTYYIGVHARDVGGQEGPMSRVVSGTPQVTMTAAELAGEKGGAPCSTGPTGAAGWLWAVGLAGVVARRSRFAAIAATAVVATIAGSTDARAADDDKWWKADTTSASADFELRYGVIFLDDPSINDVYRNNPTNLLSAEFGPQIYRVAEVDFGIGFFQELSNTVTPDLVASADRTMLTWYPLYVDATLRAHILDEQPAVPFVRYGWDYVMWSEKDDDGAGGKNSLSGAKFGTHASLGVNLLLDLLQPSRASFLEARTGINDSWLTIEWRSQAIDARRRPWSGPSEEGLSFGGNAVQVGLKLDW